MYKKVAIASALLALGGSVAHAQQHLAGSDTLHDFTVQMLADCPGLTGNLVYDGGGSGNGEKAMITNTNPANQYVAPMSRSLNASNVAAGTLFPTACDPSTGTAQGINMGLDGVSVARRESSIDSTKACDTLAYNTTINVTDGSGDSTCPGCTGGAGAHQYTFQDWRDVLRVVFGGFTHDSLPSTDNPYDPCKRAEPGRSASSAQHCNSDVRNSLVNTWSNLFQNQSCADKALGSASACSQLKHVFRRDDTSGTTDVFTVLLSMPSQTSAVSPYCGGHNTPPNNVPTDNDPIRRACTGNGYRTTGLENGEQVCQARDAKALAFPSDNFIPLQGGAGNDSTPWNPTINAPNYKQGDLGLVQTILIPEGQETAAAASAPCNPGNFGYAIVSSVDIALNTRCPNGTPQVVNKCLWPQDASGNYGCLNPSVNVPAIGELKTIDGRAYNIVMRTVENTGNLGTILVDKNSRQATGSYYRIHQTTVMPGASTGGGVPCNENDATSQIGCLVQASPCSIGYAGREAADKTTIGNNDVRSLLLPIADATGTSGPTDAAVRLLLQSSCTLSSSGTFAQRYPLSRRLWLNSLVGFGSSSIPAIQQTLATCWKDRYYSDKLIKQFGFITLDDDANHCSASDPSNSGAGRTVCQLSPTPASGVCAH